MEGACAPHFHAKYGDDEIVVGIETGKIMGAMSKRAVKMIQVWRKLHKTELLENWNRAEQKKSSLRYQTIGIKS